MAKKTTALVKWEEQLAAAAAESAATVAGLGGGNFFSIRGGTLKLGDAAIPNNEMGVIIIGNVAENVYYGSEYNPDSPSSPECYSFGTVLDQMAPHDDAPEKQHTDCASCELNQFGSADKGRGKACKNRFRLACLPAGNFVNGRFEPVTNPADIKAAQVAYLSVPPTSIGAWGQYVRGLAATMKRPPWAVYTRVRVQPDPKFQVAITFDMLGPCDGKLADVLLSRNAEVMDAIAFPYPEREDAPAPKRRSTSKKKPAKKKRFTK